MRLSLARSMLVGFLAGLLSACTGGAPTDLGAREGRLAPCPTSPNCVSSQAATDRHWIAPLQFTGDPATAFARLKGVLVARNDTTLLSETEDYLRVELRTTFFVDDAEFLLDPEHQAIHVRSASRLGYYDLGKNRSRLKEIRSAFALAGEAP